MFSKFMQTKGMLKGFFLFGCALGFILPANPRYLQYEILQFTGNFTLDDVPDKAIQEWKKSLLKAFDKQIKSIEFSDRTKVVFNLKNRTITARRLSEFIPQAKAHNPQIVTTERYGLCHSESWYMCTALGKNANVVTGKISTFSNRSPYLHSWVEFTRKDGDILCLDFTNNLVMAKQDFYWLFNAIPYEKISTSQLFADKPILEKASKNPKSVVNNVDFTKLYLSSREELLKRVEKENKKFKPRPQQEYSK